MCGIAGIVGLRGMAAPEVVVKRMTDALAHRGPDAEGVWRDGDHVALGHRRLSIIDLNPASDQPFHSSDGRYTIVYNGELYNYRELKAELTDTLFRTASDTEVMLAAYAKWGPACLERSKGMFAFALWDRERKELFVARDRLGIKPLYLYKGEGRLLFASEMRALLATGLVPRRLDREALGDYLRYQTVHAPATIVREVRMLMPGHWLRVGEGRMEEQCWWDPVARADRTATEMAPDRVRSAVRERLRNAVERRLVSDVPFGAFLSGGIDSSAVVGLMAEVTDGPVHTFSVGFEEEAFSEEKYARLVARKFHTDHTQIHLKANDLLDALPDVLAAMDHPSGDGPNTYVVSRATKRAGITMALSGLGGDELFAGYPVFTRSMALQRQRWLAALPAPLRRLGAAAVSRLKFPGGYHKLAYVMQTGSVDVDHTYPVTRQVASQQALSALLSSGTLPPDRVASIAHDLLHGRGGGELPILTQVSLLEICTYMQNVLLRDTDQMSMAHALEVRVPFLDHELVEFVLGVSDAVKFPRSPKELLTSSLGDLLPREIIDRPKMGFTLPWKRWMQEDLRSFCEERITRLGRRGVFDAVALLALWRSFLADPTRTSWARLWYLVVLEDWMERNGVEA